MKFSFLFNLNSLWINYFIEFLNFFLSNPIIYLYRIPHGIKSDFLISLDVIYGLETDRDSEHVRVGWILGIKLFNIYLPEVL